MIDTSISVSIGPAAVEAASPIQSYCIIRIEMTVPRAKEARASFR